MSFDQVDYLCGMFLKKFMVPIVCLFVIGCEESSLYQKVVFFPNKPGVTTTGPFLTSILPIPAPGTGYFLSSAIRMHMNTIIYGSSWLATFQETPPTDQIDLTSHSPMKNNGSEPAWMIFMTIGSCSIHNLYNLKKQGIIQLNVNKTCGLIHLNMS